MKHLLPRWALVASLFVVLAALVWLLSRNALNGERVDAAEGEDEGRIQDVDTALAESEEGATEDVAEEGSWPDRFEAAALRKLGGGVVADRGEGAERGRLLIQVSGEGRLVRVEGRGFEQMDPERSAAVSRYMDGQRFLVKADAADQAELRERLEAVGLDRVRMAELDRGWVSLTLPLGRLELWNLAWQTIEAAGAENGYAVEADGLSFLSAVTPNDPRFGELWGLNNDGSNGEYDADIDAPEAWALLTDASEVVVGVVDTGIRYTHEDLAGNMWVNSGEVPGDGIDNDGNGVVDDVYGYNAYGESGDPTDTHGHGTHVSGTIGGVGNNGKGVTGVAWKVQLMAAKCFGPGGWATSSDIAKAIDYAVANGAQILNNSYGSSGFSSMMFEAFEAAQDAGVILVCAAGNSSLDTDFVPEYPASFELANVISVGSCDRYEKRAFYSNRGQFTVDLFAPGSDVVSSVAGFDTDYASYSGTSMAAPHVVGALALLKARFPEASNEDLIGRLLGGVDRKSEYSAICRVGGRLNVFGSLTLTDVPRLPVFTEQPESTLVGEGSSVVLTAAVAEEDGLEWQWYFEGELIEGANGRELRIDQVKEETEGRYWAVVRGEIGVTRSGVALVEYTKPPRIVSQPSGASVKEGEDVVFRVKASGTGDLSYQWFKDGVAMPEVTRESWYVNAVEESDEGVYSVRVSNELGQVESRGVLLSLVAFRDLDLWEGVKPNPIYSNKYGVTYHDGLYVSVGSSGEIHTSFDGVSWEPHLVTAGDQLIDVAWLGNGFYAVGNSGLMLYSEDGCRWTKLVTGDAGELRGLAEGNGVKVAVGYYRVLTSESGEGWEANYFGGEHRGVAFAAGQFVIVGLGGEVYVSTNAKSWEQVATLDARLFSVTYGAGKWVAVGTENGESAVYSSVDGRSWTRVAEESKLSGFHRVVYGADGFVAVGSGLGIAYSENGDEWIEGGSSNSEITLNGVVWGEQGYVAVGTGGGVLRSESPWRWSLDALKEIGVSTSVVGEASGFYVWSSQVWDNGFFRTRTGENWTLDLTPSFENVIDVVEASPRRFALSKEGGVFRSVSEGPWETVYQLEAEAGSWKAVTVFGGKLYAVVDTGSSSEVWQSDDGSQWSVVTDFGGDKEIVALEIFGGSMFAGGSEGISEYPFLTKTTDGETWEVVTDVYGYAWSGVTSIVSGDGMLIVTLDGGLGYRSSNGEDWFVLSFGGIDSRRGVAYGNGTFVGIGGIGKIWTSSDGRTWSEVEIDYRGYLDRIAGGADGLMAIAFTDVLYSEIGYEWERVHGPVRGNLNGVFALGDRIGVVGDSVLEYSDDGETWEQVDVSSFINVYDGAYSDGRYVLSGYGPDYDQQYYAYSDDGYDWVAANVEGEERSPYRVRHVGGKFVAVGNNGSAVSEDGKNWVADSEVPDANLWDVTWGAGKYVTVGYVFDPNTYNQSESAIYCSEDGLSWEKCYTWETESQYFAGVDYGNGRFVAAGGGGTVAVSLDGEEWERVTLPETQLWTDKVIFADGRFYIPATRYKGFSSTDGYSWTMHEVNIGDFFPSDVEYWDDSIWVVGSLGNVFRSVGADLQVSPEARDFGLVFSSDRGKAFADVIGEAIAPVANEELQVYSTRRGEVVTVSIDEGGTPCVLGDDWLEIDARQVLAGQFDAIGYTVANRNGGESEEGEVSLERMPTLVPGEDAEMVLPDSTGIVSLDTDGGSGWSLAKVELSQGSGEVAQREEGILYRRRGDAETRLRLVWRKGAAVRESVLRMSFVSGLKAWEDFGYGLAGRENVYYVQRNDVALSTRGAVGLSIVEQPAVGTAEALVDGTIRYSAPAGFVGEVAVRYRLTDGSGAESEAEARIAIVEGYYPLWVEAVLGAFPELDRSLDADPMGTGRSNFERYLFGLGVEGEGLPDVGIWSVDESEGWLEVEFGMADDPDVRVVPEVFVEDAGWRAATAEGDGLILERVEDWIDAYPMVKRRATVRERDGVVILRIRFELEE